MKTERQPAADRARSVQAMFQQIAPRYDLMNRLMTGGQDISWRRAVVQRACIPPGGRVLDLGAGTGDLAREAERQSAGGRVTAADFTMGMMQVGKQQNRSPKQWTGADALNLPFENSTFDAVISGFLLRNVVDLPRALMEQYRVLKPGGWIAALDTTRPKPSLASPFVRFHMHRVIPFFGGLLTGVRDAYVYLPSTTEGFLCAEDLMDQIRLAGFEQVGFERRMFGTIAIHWARKPALVK
jgi:demethylmenaquinone methyltransferase / 2-methoxy-6-polyprenyl-1,4-benzoquinol methylase